MKRERDDDFISLILVLTFCATIFFLFIGKGPAYAGEIITKYMIGGKEYKVEKIEGEPNNYMVYWGDETFKWEPYPYMQDCVIKEGPLFYDRWIKPGLKYPWDVSLEERQKWDAADIFKMAIYGSALWFGSREYEYAANHPSILWDAKGRERFDHRASCGKGYFQPEAVKSLPKEMQGVLGRKYFEIWYEPDEAAGMGLLDFSYLDGRPDDVWFYSPSVRKVRRFSEGSRQDFLPGSTYRNEDFVITRPLHKYKLIGTELRPPRLEYFGFPKCPQKNWTDEKPKRYAGEGQPCWVIEETPAKEPWWFSKHIRWINMKDINLSLSEAYDSKGRMIRWMVHSYFLPYPDKYPLDPNWQMWPVKDLNTGFMSFDPMGFGHQPGYPDSHFYYNEGMPESAWSPQELLKEHKKPLFWR